jgi:hypothetical protein
MKRKRLLLVLLVLMAGGVTFALAIWNALKEQEDLEI